MPRRSDLLSAQLAPACPEYSRAEHRLRRPVLNARRGFLNTLECHRDPSQATVPSPDTPVRRGSPHEPHHEPADFVAVGVDEALDV
jgi:hypothetical protein